ncbi:MAG TPA: TetR/AcrR family transcriptional regulator [Sporichthyaceae bacterium]|nr:TetR/AcrR family transcriptional regulator [Sporichthyaceae bacterium]
MIPEAVPPLRGQAARWAGQRERRRAEFVDAALGVIAEQGPAVSVEDIAARVGVARTRLYRHFTDRADLERAISERVARLVMAELEPLWRPQGSARQMIAGAIGSYVRWIGANRNLHLYLHAHARPTDDATDAETDAVSGVRRAVAEHLSGLFGGYLGLLGLDPSIATDLAHAVVGMVESVADRWAAVGGSEPDAVIERLGLWTWAMLADTLAGAGVTLDPDLPLPPLG